MEQRLKVGERHRYSGHISCRYVAMWREVQWCLIGAMGSVYEGEYPARMWGIFAPELNFCGELLRAEYVG